MDSLLAFQLDKENVRGRFTQVGPTLTNILKNHNYPDGVAFLLSEATLLTALIGEMIKLRWRLSLQIRSDGPVKLLATDYFAANKRNLPARLRAYADFDKEYDFSKPEASRDLLGEGFFSIIIDQGKNMEPYKGITRLIEGGLAKSAENYFLQSEQISTFFAIDISKNHEIKKGSPWRALGFMLQELPNLEGKKKNIISKELKLLTEKMKEKFTKRLNPEKFDEYQFIEQVFETMDITVYKQKKIKFGCSCKKENVICTLKRHSSKELQKMGDSKGIIQADCQFCGKVYQINISKIVY
tara:strand:- start:2189 stop:3082 length:894 start_codon:yes stop_codon:yes gene_type:complete